MLKKEEMRQWLRDRLQLQSRLATGALAGMVVLGLIATLMEFALFFVIIKIGFIRDSPAVLAFLATAMILAVIQAATLLRMPKQLADVEHEAELDESIVIIKVASNMSAVWTYALGSMESDRSWVEILLGLLSLPQRLCSAAWFTWQRKKELLSVAVEPCAAIIRLLHKEGERVELKTIAADLNTGDLVPVIRQLSLIDGVVFLSQKNFGLSLANRLVDDIVDWKEKKMAEKNVPQ